jgi:stage II sporulation protein D
MTMKSIWREFVMSVMMAMVLPGILLNWPVEKGKVNEQSLVQGPTEPWGSIQKVSLEMKLRKKDGTLETMDMDAYLVGVLLAELPSTFEAEAKKAQAVAARTYARKASETGGKHGDGSVCENAACCQAHIFPEDYLALGGSREAIDEAKSAVEATSGLVLTYEGTLIEATYFSCSGGITEDAVAVWGTDFPYLRSVDSPGEEHAAHYEDTVYFTKSELQQKLGLALVGNPGTWFRNFQYTAGGGVETVNVGGVVCAGTFLRTKLGLRSTAFTVTADEEGITITTKGFGHRVGMSQYGADAMAMDGKNYREILAHYYAGTTLELTNDRG